MFSGSVTSRASFSLTLDRPSSSRGRADQTHSPGSSARGSISKPVQIPPPPPPPSREIVVQDPKRQDTKHAAKYSVSMKYPELDSNDQAAHYPLSYEPKALGLDVLDHIFFLQTWKSVTWVDFKDRPPTRSLDLGCGVTWVLDAAKAWKDCHFVGFDLANIQPKPHLLPPALADRIQWVHGDFLSEKLPFEDNYFDHVHAVRIAWGVGEMQWDGLFEEITRVLCPGGVIEIAEEDILFPTLPRSYTIGGGKSRPYPRPSLTLSSPPSPSDKPTSTHAHSLLESLFFGIFESRMINLRPTAIIPHHLNIHFRNVHSTHLLEFPFPPPPVSRQQLRHVPSDCTARPGRRPSEGSDSILSFDLASQDQQQEQHQTPSTSTSSLSSPSDSSTEESVIKLPPFKPPPPIHVAFRQANAQSGASMLPPVMMDSSAPNLALQLNTAYQRILACKQAMWEELRRRLLLRRAGGEDLLQNLEWDDQAEEDQGDSSDSGHGHGDGPGWGEARELEQARVLFEDLIARFERDMRYRTALADAIQTALDWRKPAPAPMSKYERAREVELDRVIAEAAKAEAREPEQAQCSRSFKAFVGFKEGKR